MSFPEIAPADAHADLERFRVIDVREDYEFHGPLGCVAGAEHIPLSTVAANAERLSDSPPLLLVCRSGKRSGKACETLQELGIQTVTNLDGGMIAWNRAGLPVKRTQLKTLDELVSSIVYWVAQVTATSQDDARSRIDALLREGGAAIDGPTLGAVDHVLDALTGELRETGAPPDLELTVNAYRKDLAVL
jgi:rhodanese-related sulfurtransferase